MVPACSRPPNTPAQQRWSSEHPLGSSWHPQSPGQGWNPLLYLAHRGDAPGCCWGSHPGSPPRSWTAHSCPGEEAKDGMTSLLHRGPAEVQSRSQGQQLQRATHKPHAIEGHLFVEVLHHVVPPLMSRWVGEVWEGRGAWPDLQEGERWAEPPAPHTSPPSPTAPQTFLSHSWGPAPTTPLGTGAAPHTHLADQGLPRGVSDEYPSLQPLIVGLVGARGA